MRTENSIKNILSSFASNIILDIIKFVCRIIFVKLIGETYLGVNGLLTNVLGLLALSELGISTAINYSLYEPIAKDDKEKIKSLMQFYKKSYHAIALFVLIVGLILLPFLPYFIKDTSGIQNLNIIYLIFLINQVIGYLFSYKRTLVVAEQKSYKLVPFTVLSTFLMNIFQIIFLFITRNYIVYLIIQSLFILLENIIINRYIDKEYSYINDTNIKKIDDKELNKIKTNIKALLFHKIGTYAVTSTDNLIISKFIGIEVVGYYSNYASLITIISNIIYTFVNNVTASFGNLIVKESPERRLKVFEEINFIYYIMYCIATICFINLFNPFIAFVYGENFVLDLPCMYLISLNFYFTGMLNIIDLIKSAAGLYDKDKWVPIIQSIINLVVSIVLAINYGLAGVFIGTLVSTLFCLLVKPIVVYKYVFEQSSSKYFNNFFKQLIVFGTSILLTVSLVSIINTNNPITQIIINLLISIIIPSILLILTYNNSEEFNNATARIKKILKRS